MDSNEVLLVVAGVAVIVGVFMEGWEHWEDIKARGWRPLTPKFGFAILVLGLFAETYAEIRIGQADTQFRVDAIEKAARLTQATGELYRERDDRNSFRLLNINQQRRIEAKLVLFAGITFDLIGVEDVGEATNLQDTIGDVLKASGWKRTPAQPGTIIGPGMSVRSSRRLVPAANALCDALAAEGIATWQIIGRPDRNPNTIHIIIGKKP